MGEFPFEEGNRVLVRVRAGDSLSAKFAGRVTSIDEQRTLASTARIDVEGLTSISSHISVRPYDAEFEVLGEDEEVTF